MSPTTKTSKNTMNDEHLWGYSPWQYSELQSAIIENTRNDCPLIGGGMLRVMERPSGEQKIEIIREYTLGYTGHQEIISIPPELFHRIQKHPDTDKANYILV